jgi:hypothetical protein
MRTLQGSMVWASGQIHTQEALNEHKKRLDIGLLVILVPRMRRIVSHLGLSRDFLLLKDRVHARLVEAVIQLADRVARFAL